MVFDVLEVDGKDWRAEPLWKRRRALEEPEDLADVAKPPPK
jgi:ATP-dependent DNA ligase